MADAYGRCLGYLRLSVTERCNLRCRYCMPETGIEKKAHTEMLTEDEMIAAVEAAASLGVTKLRLTGGEPLVKKNILSIAERAAKVPGIREVCMTTNGTLLPAMAKPLRAAGVDRVNISLDTLDPDKFASITRCGRFDDAMAGIRAALDAGFEKVKLNTVLIGGFNDDEIVALTDLTRELPLTVRFIELMPMAPGSGFGPEQYVSADAVLNALPELVPAEQDGGVAKLYRLPGAMGEVGLIRPMTAHFCASCNRLRLTADGKLKPCLHSPDEISVKGLSKEGMREAMTRAMALKPQRRANLSATEFTGSARSMDRIGG
ncbi:MAG: GTP 3',8-cyclase MoaA [Clostridia bacterium]|nr:GTP 3',8-cyclase MoaA [Clostridia bacterium]